MTIAYDARRLVQMGPLVLDGATVHWQFRAPPTCFSTTNNLAKKRVSKTALKQYLGLARETESREGRGECLYSDEEGLNEEQQLVLTSW